MVFEWDNAKNRANQIKHEVSFETASEVFDDPLHISIPDRVLDGEQRWQTMGIVGTPIATMETRRSCVSSQPEKRRERSAEAMKAVRSAKKRATELARLAAKSEDDIDTSDIPETSAWSRAVVGKFYRPVKTQVTLRIDADVLHWFKANGGKYQSAVNAALREHVVRKSRKAPVRRKSG
jgi:uncharacterized protein (DUF4415 family)